MGHDTLNKTISIPNLPRNPHVWDTPAANTLYIDHPIDTAEDLRDKWLSDEIKSNPLMSAEDDSMDLRYGSELGRFAVRTKRHEPSLMDDEPDEPELEDEDDDEENPDGYYAN